MALFFSILRFDREVKPIGRPKHVFFLRGGFLGVGRSQTDKSLSLSLSLTLRDLPTDLVSPDTRARARTYFRLAPQTLKGTIVQLAGSQWRITSWGCGLLIYVSK